MNERRFWSLVEAAKREADGDCYEQAESLQNSLDQLSPEEIITFDEIFFELENRAYRNDLWDAASLLDVALSDDAFLYFRRWLIGQGETLFNKALQDPDSLAEIELEHEDDATCEPLGYVAMRAYKTKTGSEMPHRELVFRDLVGEECSEAELPVKFPKLWAKYVETE